MTNKRGRGRPAGKPDTKGHIARTARQLFVEHGYAATSMRAVARAAEVDQALIGYHFGSKAGLFSAALAVNQVPATILDQALAGDPTTAPERVLAAVLHAWDDPEFGGALAEIIGAAFRDADLMRTMREYISAAIGQRLVEFLGGPDARALATACEAVLAGLIFSRYLIRIEPIASRSSAEVVRDVAPVLRVAMGGPGRLARLRPTSTARH
ncbi:TetR/AcrR family transcriptional regulator [Luteipulveratus halotolerans]|uniref:TetR/AcrR family transcriptional regulator n=1 Tax=Luteipulveratus halotolerans TaxID=1631356 RepID=UPI000681D10D|nr:TetR family transcriptional regulator [Luteipulveratus halotolerans]